MSNWDSRGTQRAMALLSRVRAVHDYDAQETDELSLRAGDIILVTKARPSSQDWWEGIVNDRKGLFPANYVEPFRDPTLLQDKAAKPRHESAPETAALAKDIVLQSAADTAAVPPTLASAQSPVRTPTPAIMPLSTSEHAHAAALRSSSAVATATAPAVAPAVASATAAAAAPAAAVDRPREYQSSPTSSVGGTMALLAVALFDFEGIDEEDLSFREGDTLRLLEHAEGEDWWRGELVGTIQESAQYVRGRRGMFPASYVRLNSLTPSPPPPSESDEIFAERVVSESSRQHRVVEIFEREEARLKAAERGRRATLSELDEHRAAQAETFGVSPSSGVGRDGKLKADVGQTPHATETAGSHTDGIAANIAMKSRVTSNKKSDEAEKINAKRRIPKRARFAEQQAGATGSDVEQGGSKGFRGSVAAPMVKWPCDVTLLPARVHALECALEPFSRGIQTVFVTHTRTRAARPSVCGVGPTFDSISVHASRIDLATFWRCLRDIGLLRSHRTVATTETGALQVQKRLTKQEATDLFHKVAKAKLPEPAKHAKRLASASDGSDHNHINVAKNGNGKFIDRRRFGLSLALIAMWSAGFTCGSDSPESERSSDSTFASCALSAAEKLLRPLAMGAEGAAHRELRRHLRRATHAREEGIVFSDTPSTVAVQQQQNEQQMRARRRHPRQSSGSVKQQRHVLAVGQPEGPQPLHHLKQAGQHAILSEQTCMVASQTPLFATPTHECEQKFQQSSKMPKKQRWRQQPRQPPQSRQRQAYQRKRRQDGILRQQTRQGTAGVMAKAVPKPTQAATYLPPPRRPVGQSRRSGSKQLRLHTAASHVPKPPSHQRHRRMRVADHIHLLEQRQD